MIANVKSSLRVQRRSQSEEHPLATLLWRNSTNGYDGFQDNFDPMVTSGKDGS